MSIGGILRTSVSGMNAQATRLGTVAENIANSDTTGYKQSQTEFSSLILPSNSAGYNSGAVDAQVRTFIGEQGGISYTGNDNDPRSIDLAIDGDGFLAVSDGSGTYLTRAGAFIQQADGSLVNAAGFTLMGYPVTSTGVDSVLNGFTGLQEVNLKTALLSANPTTEGILTVPLNKEKSAAKLEGSFTQVAALGTLPATVPLSFELSVDGATAVPVIVAATGVDRTPAQLVIDMQTAINTAFAAPATPPTVTLVSGKLVLTSPTQTTNTFGSGSSIAMTVTSSPTTFSGFASFAKEAATGNDLPSYNRDVQKANDANTTSTSITVYNNSGEAVKLDIYYTKTADETWEVSIFDSRKASKDTVSSPFPYGTAGDSPLATATLGFNNTTFTLESVTGGINTSSPGGGVLAINLGNATNGIGGEVFNLNIGKMTQFTGQTQPLDAKVNGNPAEVINDISVGVDGTITAYFASGTARDLFKVPLALVNSPDSMQVKAGNVYSPGIESGTVLMGFGGSAGFGNLTAGALEESTVDLASELTTMIESQRSYTANSKVFQTGSEILDVLVNLKR